MKHLTSQRRGTERMRGEDVRTRKMILGDFFPKIIMATEKEFRVANETVNEILIPPLTSIVNGYYIVKC